MLGELAQAFDLSLWTVLPALLILAVSLVLIRVLTALFDKAIRRSKIDPTIHPLLRTVLRTLLTVLAMLAIGALTPVLGGMLGLLLPLGVVLFILIILHPYAPKVLNNVGFAYLTVACIDSAAFAANLPLFFGVYIVGSLVFNGGCVLLMKPARYLAARSIKNDVKADA